MWVRKCILIAVFSGLVAFYSADSRAAELKHPGVSTRGATSAQTQWNLICDPPYAVSGSVTTYYTASTATLTEVTGLGPYTVTSAIVQVSSGGQTTYDTFTSSNNVITMDLTPGIETGYVQVFWDITGTAPAPANDDNTHMLIFTDTNASDLNAVATFQDYLDPGPAAGGQSETADSYTALDSSGNSYTVTASTPGLSNDPRLQELVGTPEPSSIALIGLVAAGALCRRPRRSPLPA